MGLYGHGWIKARKKHIRRDVERMIEVYLERDRRYLGIIGGIERNIYMHEKKGTLKKFALFLTIENICFLMILFVALAMHPPY